MASEIQGRRRKLTRSGKVGHPSLVGKKAFDKAIKNSPNPSISRIVIASRKTIGFLERVEPFGSTSAYCRSTGAVLPCFPGTKILDTDCDRRSEAGYIP